MQTGSIEGCAMTSDERLALTTDVITFRELGLPRLSLSDWLGIFAPKGRQGGTSLPGSMGRLWSRW
jgi:tripartite-type tricarboxylate transporter receptor subunit TctC